MLTRAPAYNKNFRCLGGACPDTCCRDWSIVPDERALSDYAAAPEPLRGAIAAALTRDDDGDVCFRLDGRGFCALLTEDGLCPIQRDWGEAHLCAHCAAYPRFTEEYGPLTETALAISCPEAARLLLESGPFTLEETDDGRADPPLPGVDGELLAQLERSRAAALALLTGRTYPLWDRLGQVIAYAGELQDAIDWGDCSAMADCAPESPVPVPGGNRRLFTARLMELCAALESLRPAWKDELTAGSEALLGMKQSYAGLCAGFERAHPRWEAHLEALACYLVFRHWHKTVNDDGLYGRAALAGAACLLLYHLWLLRWRERGSLSPDDEIALCCAFSREIEHLEENLIDLIEALFDDQTWPILSALSDH